MEYYHLSHLFHPLKTTFNQTFHKQVSRQHKRTERRMGGGGVRKKKIVKEEVGESVSVGVVGGVRWVSGLLLE